MKVKYLIIGAGISGLAAAHALGDDYLIVEKENEVGGYCRTIRKDGFVWDYAGHFFHFKTEKYRDLFLKNTPPEDIIVQDKRTSILYKGELIDYPFQTNIHQLPKEEFIDCLYDLFHREQKEDYESFQDMLYGKFGKSIVEKFLRPYNEKLYACDLRTLDKDAMGRFFPYADIPQIIDNMKRGENASYNASFLYPRNGAGSFMDLLYAQLEASRVRLGCTVTAVDLERKTALLDTGETVEYDVLINTMPLNRFLRRTGREQDAALAGQLSYNKVLVFNLGFEKKSDFKEHWIYVPESEANYYRIGFYDNILGTDRLSMYIEIGYPKGAEIHVDEQLELTLQNLRRHGVVQPDNALVAWEPIIMDPGYVHINTEHEQAIRALKQEMASLGAYTIGRYGGWTYCSMEDCMLEAEGIVETLTQSPHTS